MADNKLDIKAFLDVYKRQTSDRPLKAPIYKQEQKADKTEPPCQG